ncbi:unnamed protein product [Fusarium venenatum]|uniref:Heterokaryon incompatibility domain-containing protein n=1 Tax=Fusarium venenatum TaxID=56646 RepID=A0A2L2TR18_9HYPO|nr:uncharacterized protein FVRRES_07766 [Fusarium venenatum]CEI63330.1 unnamed protein product [Fusarium venenatum]
MSLCQVCRGVLPSIPLTDGNRAQGSVAAFLSDPVYRSGGLFEDQWTLRGDFPVHKSWESLKRSISHDCPLCWTIWRCIRSSPIASPNDEEIAEFKTEIVTLSYEPDNSAYTVDMCLMGLGLKTKELKLAIWKTTEKWYLDTERALPLVDQHTSESVSKLANQWIRTCEANHSECLKEASPPRSARMPTRLLDLGHSNSDTWRIHENPCHVPYIALSHRWSSETPTLLMRNYYLYSDSQPDSVLPQNYKDIVSICRSMDVRYLWIDSLCIIQDDGGLEFRREAPLMTDIYQYAFLTLTICWDSPGLSILRKCQPRSIPRQKPAALYTQQDSISQIDEYVFVEHRDALDVQVDVDRAPLNRRAWVLQERYLSRRLLHLGNEQVYWECNGYTGSEISPTAYSPAYKRTETERQSMADLTGPDRDTNWSWVLSKYTGYDLTFERDRLVAIAGLAKLIARKTGDTYLAGIWLESWMQDLLWEPANGPDSKLVLQDEDHSLMNQFSRPSWSWLAFPGSVMPGRMIKKGPKISLADPNSFKSKEFQPLALLSQIIITPPGSDPFASFDRAILRIRCLLLPVRLTIAPQYEGPQWYFRHDLDFTVPATGINCMELRACEPYIKWGSAFRFHFSKPFISSAQHFLLPLYEYHYRRDLDEPGHKVIMVYGLVVKEAPSDNTREFIRVGTWQDSHHDPSQLSPMISNTIVERGIGRNSALRDDSLIANERLFDSKLGEYAIHNVASKVLLPLSNTEELNETFVRKRKTHKTVECSLLPHFNTAEWDTISLQLQWMFC